MADDTTDATDAQAPDDPQTPGTEETQDDTDWKAEAERWKALSRKHEDRAKANYEKATKYDSYLDSQKTEQQKTADRIAATEKARDDALRDAALARAALTHGLTADDLDLIAAGTPEEIEARAEKLATRLKSSAPTPAPDPLLGRETPPGADHSSGDWLRDSLAKK